jgi:hypothetical protein
MKDTKMIMTLYGVFGYLLAGLHGVWALSSLRMRRRDTLYAGALLMTAIVSIKSLLTLGHFEASLLKTPALYGLLTLFSLRISRTPHGTHYFALKLFVSASFIIVLAQLLIPSHQVWILVAENSWQLAQQAGGARPMGIFGNTTHSSYATLVCTVAILTSRGPVLVAAFGALTLLLLGNKITVAVGLLAGLWLALRHSRGRLRTCLLLLGGMGTVGAAMWTIMELVRQGGINARTITHRIEIIGWMHQNFNPTDWLFGNVNLYFEMDEAFDSLFLLLLTQQGIIGTVLTYAPLALIAVHHRKLTVLLFCIIAPTITMVGFYHTFMIPLVAWILSRATLDPSPRGSSNCQ